LQEVLYIETERVGATVYRRGADGWAEIALGAQDRLRLETIGLDTALADLYRGVPGL
jgi:hypothetical protein